MPYVIILSGIIFILLLLLLLKKEKQIKNSMQQLKKMQVQLQVSQEKAEKFMNKSQSLWNFANTIHLYASLSEEDTQNESLKQKQLEILNLSQEIMNILEDKEKGLSGNR